MPVDWAGYGYAALVASGGVMGYVKAGEHLPLFLHGQIESSGLSLAVC